MDISSLDKALIGEVWTSPDLYANLEALCDFGSPGVSKPSERACQALRLASIRLSAALRAYSAGASGKTE